MQPQNSQSEAGGGGSFVLAGLTECEAVIERGLAAFVEVGGALARIRDERLYRETHGTFEDYCKDRWKFSRQTGYDLMQTAEVVGIVQEVGQPPPSRESARELAPLRGDPQRVRAKWQETLDKYGLDATGKQVREVVAPKTPLKAKPESPEPEGSGKKKRPPKTVICPGCSQEIKEIRPPHLRGVRDPRDVQELDYVHDVLEALHATAWALGEWDPRAVLNLALRLPAESLPSLIEAVGETRTGLDQVERFLKAQLAIMTDEQESK
jgi:hypothetical protein